jgi:predicted DNA-binding transcriptional regulator AlpA
MTSLSPSQLRLMSKRGEFPAPRKLSAKRIAWVRSEVADWIADKVTGR